MTLSQIYRQTMFDRFISQNTPPKIVTLTCKKDRIDVDCENRDPHMVEPDVVIEQHVNKSTHVES